METNGLPVETNGLPVIVDIRPESFSLEEKRRLIDELCGSWAGDSSLNPIFTEIGRVRCDSRPREVNFFDSQYCS